MPVLYYRCINAMYTISCLNKNMLKTNKPTKNLQYMVTGALGNGVGVWRYMSGAAARCSESAQALRQPWTMAQRSQVKKTSQHLEQRMWTFFITSGLNYCVSLLPSPTTCTSCLFNPNLLSMWHSMKHNNTPQGEQYLHAINNTEPILTKKFIWARRSCVLSRLWLMRFLLQLLLLFFLFL